MIVLYLTATKCENPSFGNDVEVDYSHGDLHGSVATFFCAAGYKLVGVQSVVCAAESDDADWPAADNECQQTTCASPPADLQHVKITDSNGNYHTSEITFECEPAAGVNAIFTGNESITCTALDADSTWPIPNPTPTCTLTCAYRPIAPGNGTVTFVNSTNNASIVTVEATFSCNPGYRLIGDADATCSTEGPTTLWHANINTSTTCEPNYCTNAPTAQRDGLLEFTNGDRYESVAKFTCKSGFQFNGTASVECAAKDANEDWPTPTDTPTCTYDGSNSNLDTQGRFTKYSAILNFGGIYQENFCQQ